MFRRTFVTFCALAVSLFAVNAHAQNAATSSIRSVENAREITRAMRPEIVNRLRDDNVLITQDVRFADQTALQRVARSGSPSYVVITRTLPHPYKSPFTLARDISLQLDTASNAIVIVATEADGYLGVYSPDIEYSMLQKIANRSALSWTSESYAVGAAQTLRLVAAERQVQQNERRNRIMFLFSGLAAGSTALCFSFLWKRSRRRVTKMRKETEVSESTIS